MNLKEQLDALLDATAFDSTGAKVGAVRQVYVDDASGKLTFATVSTGIFSADAIVPLHGARLLDDELHVDHTRDVIRDSPRPDNTEDALAPEQEVKLLEYYGLDAPATGRGAAEPRPTPTSEKKPGKKPGSESGKAKGAKEKSDVAKSAPAQGSADKTADKSSADKSSTEKGGTDKPDSAKPVAAKGSPVKPGAGTSAPSPAKNVATAKKDEEKSTSPTGSVAKPVGADGDKKTAAPAAAPGDKAGRKVADGEKKMATTTSASSPGTSPGTSPATRDRTRAERPGSTEPDTAATSKNAGDDGSAERD